MSATVIAMEWKPGPVSRVRIIMDGGRTLSVSEAVGASLEIGQVLSDEDIAAIQQRDIEQRYFQRAVRLLSIRPRSEYELIRYFKKHEVPEASQRSILSRLKDQELVDDWAFAAAWVENRNSFRPRGVRALRSELRAKGVPSAAIEASLLGFKEDEAAYHAASKAARRYKDLSYSMFRRRVGAYLSRRGFQFSTIWPVVERVWRETPGGGDESEG